MNFFLSFELCVRPDTAYFAIQLIVSGQISFGWISCWPDIQISRYRNLAIYPAAYRIAGQISGRITIIRFAGYYPALVFDMMPDILPYIQLYIGYLAKLAIGNPIFHNRRLNLIFGRIPGIIDGPDTLPDLISGQSLMKSKILQTFRLISNGMEIVLPLDGKAWPLKTGLRIRVIQIRPQEKSDPDPTSKKNRILIRTREKMDPCDGDWHQCLLN